jgi:hypothetical protein
VLPCVDMKNGVPIVDVANMNALDSGSVYVSKARDQDDKGRSEGV